MLIKLIEKRTELLIILLKKEPEELEKLEKFFVKVLKQRLKQKKTLPYWKDWKKTERNFLSKSENSWSRGYT